MDRVFAICYYLSALACFVVSILKKDSPIELTVLGFILLIAGKVNEVHSDLKEKL